MVYRKNPLVKILLLTLPIYSSSCVFAETIKSDWVKVGEGSIAIGGVQSYVDMNDIQRMNTDIISFKFVTNIVSANASNVITVLLNCKNDLYNVIDDRIYSGLFGSGAASDSINHGKDFIVVKGTQLENVAKLVCAKKV